MMNKIIWWIKNSKEQYLFEHTFLLSILISLIILCIGHAIDVNINI